MVTECAWTLFKFYDVVWIASWDKIESCCDIMKWDEIDLKTEIFRVVWLNKLADDGCWDPGGFKTFFPILFSRIKFYLLKYVRLRSLTLPSKKNK